MKRIIINLDEYNELKNNYELSKLEIEDLKDELKLCYSSISELKELVKKLKNENKEFKKNNKNRQNSIIHLQSYNKKLKYYLKLSQEVNSVFEENTIKYVNMLNVNHDLKCDVDCFALLVEDIKEYIIESLDSNEIMSLFENLIEERIGFMKYKEILKNGKN